MEIPAGKRRDFDGLVKQVYIWRHKDIDVIT